MRKVRILPLSPMSNGLHPLCTKGLKVKQAGRAFPLPIVAVVPPHREYGKLVQWSERWSYKPLMIVRLYHFLPIYASIA